LDITLKPHAKTTALAGLCIILAGHALSCGSSDPAAAAPGAGSGGSGHAGAGGSPHDAGPIRNGNVVVWTQPISTKVQPSTAVGSSGEVVVEAPRDAYESYEVVVHAQGGRVDDVTVEPGDLTDGVGHVLAASNIELFREYYVDLSGVDGLTGNVPVPDRSPTADARIPDPLLPMKDPYGGKPLGQPFSVPEGENQVVWVDIHVPRDTVAGAYSGAISVSAGGEKVASVPVTVVVRDVVLPDMRSVRTYFPMRGGELIRYHRGIYDCDGGSCYLEWYDSSRELVKRYEELAHAHRIDTGQNFVRLPDDCTPASDWSEYDAAIAPYMDGSYWADGVPSTRLDTPFSPGASYGLEGDCTQSQYVAVAKAWADHLRSKGWWERAVAFSVDEPEPDQYDAIARNSGWLQQADPGWKAHVLLTEAPRADNIDVLGPAVGVFAVPPKNYDSWMDSPESGYLGRAEWPGLIAQGTQLWFYESNSNLPPFPTLSSNTLDALEPRIFMWGSWFEHASGFLFWSIDAWPSDESAWGPNVVFGKFGDGILLYPGNHDGTADAALGSPPDVEVDGPIPSYRLKVLRDGLQDWALFRLAEDKGLGEMVRDRMKEVYSRLGGCTYQGCVEPDGGFFWKTDAAAMARIRHEVMDALEAAR